MVALGSSGNALLLSSDGQSRGGAHLPHLLGIHSLT